MTAHVFAVGAPPSLSALPASGWLESVCEPKRTRILNQRNPQAAATQLCAEVLLWYALYSAYRMDHLSFERECTPLGKPYFADPAAPYYSLSHSGKMAVCALHRAPVGADVERVRAVSPALARRIMSDPEFEAFNRSTDKDGFFFRIWTLKESYLKQTGHGISYDLKNLSFSIDSEQNVSFNAPQHVFRLYSLPGGYQACACTDKGTLPEHVACIDIDELIDFAYR